MTPGKIIIKDKVYFEPDGLEKPISPGLDGSFSEDINYIKAVEKYRASKQLIEVSNSKQIHWLYFFYFGSAIVMHPDYELKDGIKVKVEITGETCTIVELIK